MASDEQVSSQHILQALLKVKREGSNRVMQHLESVERELAGYLMEELSLIHQKLLELGASARRTQLLVRRVESLALVCVTALRESHYQLWRREVAEGPLADLDPSLGESEHPPPPPGGDSPEQDS